MSEETQTIKTGLLQKIIFYKQETSFIIASFIGSETKEPFSSKGTIVNPQIGLTYKLTGTMEQNGSYGEQLNFKMFETVLPRDENGIFKYIVRICKFVGNKTGNILIDTFGADTLDIMKNDPERISRIKGITLERAREIQSTLLENEKTEAVMVELESILDIPGIRKNLIAELINKFKSNAAEVVKKNPYILTSFPGTSFILADRVAMNIGLSPTSIDRKKAAVCHVMHEKNSSGDIWVEKRTLIQETSILINVMGCEDGAQVLLDEDLLALKHSCIAGDEKMSWYAFANDAAKEDKIAEKLSELMKNEPLIKTAVSGGGRFNGI